MSLGVTKFDFFTRVVEVSVCRNSGFSNDLKCTMNQRSYKRAELQKTNTILPLLKPPEFAC